MANNEILCNPNPFSDYTNIEYILNKPEFVNLSILDQFGNIVTVLVDEFKEDGVHYEILHSSGLSSGIYFYRLSIGLEVFTGKIILLR
jgi:hypothetical protein